MALLPGLQNLTRLAALAGLATLVLSIIMMSEFPASAELREGFTSPVIAFEFARSDEDLAFMRGQERVAVEHRRGMQAGLAWDMWFPFAYAGLLLFLLLQMVRRGQTIAWAGVPFALLVIPFDINENLVMLGIVRVLEQGQPATDLLPGLYLATWLKWGAIAIAALFLGLARWQQAERWQGGLALVFSLSLAICYASNSAPVVCEAMALVSVVFFLVFGVSQIIRGVNTFRDDPSS